MSIVAGSAVVAVFAAPLSANAGAPVTREHLHEFFDLVASVAIIAGRESLCDAGFNVAPQNNLSDLSERGLRCGDLEKNVDAVLVVLDHASDAADLAFDPLEACEYLLLILIVEHTITLPLQGILFNTPL
jgi:hypothetical protein